MKIAILVLGLALHLVHGESLVNVRLPFLNPAGVTYINGPTPTGLVAGPVHPVQFTSAVQHAQPHFQQISYSAPSHLRAAPIQFAQPALRAAPVFHQVPAVADIPVTRIEAHHGVVQNLVDVAKPAIKTRKFEVRRPAIQKQFYDIEERVIVRPAGSALVELEQPISKNQKGIDVISPLAAVAPVIPVAGVVHHHQPVFVSSTPLPPAPVDFSFEHPRPQFPTPAPPQAQQPANEEDSVVVEARARFQQFQQFAQQQQFRTEQQPQQEVRQQSFRNVPQQVETQAIFRQDQQSEQQQQFHEAQPQHQQQQPTYQHPEMRSQRQSSELQQQQQEQVQELQQQQQNQLQQLQQRHVEEQQVLEHQNEQHANIQARNQPQQQQQQRDASSQPQQKQPQVDTQSNGAIPSFRFNQSPESDSPVVYSRQVTAEESHDNQQRLIQLLTARNSLTEIGNHQQGSARSSNLFNDAGVIRARVLSATPAPFNAEPSDERVNTRRVVLSRPIETIQEVVVQEPVTKFEKVAINTPTIFKTARLGVQRVHTSVPAVPVYQQHPHFTTSYHGIQ